MDYLLISPETVTSHPIPTSLHTTQGGCNRLCPENKAMIASQVRRLGKGDSELSGADAENLGATGWANTLSCRLPILHRNFLGILNLALAPALYTIGFH